MREQEAGAGAGSSPARIRSKWPPLWRALRATTHGWLGHVFAAAARHAFPILWFALIAAGLTRGIWSAPDRTLIGDGLGDNISFVWNFWWAGVALPGPDHSLFATDAIFAPIGTSLILHAGTPLLTSVAMALPHRPGPVAAYNLWLALALFLNGVCAYAAAYRATGRRDAAMLGGTIFAASPFLVIRLLGHLNVLNAWGLPLLALATDRLLAKPGLARAVLTGAILGTIGFIDYYYFIFGALLLALLACSSRWPLTIARTPLTPRRRRLLRGCACLAGVAALVALLIAATGGTEIRLAGQLIRLRGTFNLRLGAWLLTIAAIALWYGPRLQLRRDGLTTPVDGLGKFLALAALTATVVVSPLLAGGAWIWRSGDYVSARYVWRSAPPGIDIASLVLGNPTGYLSGAATVAAYRRWNIDGIESVAWLGIVPAVLAFIAIRRLRERPQVRHWLLVLTFFGIWSLGPYLMAFGTNSAFMLPQTALRFIPVVSNARMPGRAFTLVVLAVAMLAAMAAAASAASTASAANPRRRRVVAAAWLALTLLDYWPAPYPTTGLTTYALDKTLASMPKDVLLELPLGIRDGFGGRGRFNDAGSYHQMTHGHPMVGGYVSRLSDRVRQPYERDAVLAPLMALSAGVAPPNERALASPADSLACAVRYLIVPADTSGATQAFVDRVFVLTRADGEPSRTLFTVSGFRAPYCGKS